MQKINTNLYYPKTNTRQTYIVAHTHRQNHWIFTYCLLEACSYQWWQSSWGICPVWWTATAGLWLGQDCPFCLRYQTQANWAAAAVAAALTGAVEVAGSACRIRSTSCKRSNESRKPKTIKKMNNWSVRYRTMRKGQDDSRTEQQKRSHQQLGRVCVTVDPGQCRATRVWLKTGRRRDNKRPPQRGRLRKRTNVYIYHKRGCLSV